MPAIEYYANDNDKYTSMMEMNIAIDEVLAKIMYVDFTNYGFKNIESYPEDPCDFDTITEVGNYVVYFHTNTPDDLAGVTPLNISVSKRENVIHQIVLNMLDVYYRTNPLDDNGNLTVWSDWETVTNIQFPVFVGSEEPTPETTFAFWIDTKLKGFPVIYGYTETVGWFGIGSLVDAMYGTIYDMQNKRVDIFTYFEDKFGIPSKNGDKYILVNIEDALAEDVVTFFNLKAKFTNHFLLGHMTLEERQAFETMLSVKEVQDKVNEAVDVILSYLNDKISEGNLIILRERLNSAEKGYSKHVKSDIHASITEKIDWNAKASADHEHDIDNKVILRAEDVTTGILSSDLLPDSVKHILKRVVTHADKYNLTTDDVQTGDSVYVIEDTSDLPSGLYLVYDDTKLDRPEGYIYYRSRRYANIDFEDIINKPNTIEGYHIMDGNYVRKNEDGSFIYPYETLDSTFNYALTKAIKEFTANMTNVLDNIEFKMLYYRERDIWTLARNNIIAWQESQNQWNKYRLINGKTIIETHNENISTLSEISALCKELEQVLYYAT